MARIFTGLGLLLWGCGKPLTPEECAQLLDRYTELLMASDRPELSHAEVEQLKQTLRITVSHHPEIYECRHRVSRREYECAIHAPNADILEQCLL